MYIYIPAYAKRSTWMNLTLTLFLLNSKISQDEGGRFWIEAIKSKSTRVHKVIPILDRPSIFNCLLNPLLVLAFKLWLSFNYTKQVSKGVSDDKISTIKING